MYVSSECMYPGGCEDKPFLKRQMVVASSMVVGRIGWTNKMCLGGKGWMCDVLSTMILNPIILVDCIIMPIYWMGRRCDGDIVQSRRLIQPKPLIAQVTMIDDVIDV